MAGLAILKHTYDLSDEVLCERWVENPYYRVPRSWCVPTLIEAREIIAEFHLMIRRKTEAGLVSWIGRAGASLVASFAGGVAKDEAAVRAAITLPWSNGQTEGQITRLKLVRRQMYGRGKIDLLQARLIGAE